MKFVFVLAVITDIGKYVQ